MTEYEYLAHIGMPRRSGRYPWGSGNRPFQGTGGPKTVATKKAIASEGEKHTSSSGRLSKTDIKMMSDSEVQDRIKRLESEKKLRDLSRDDNRITGSKLIQDVLSESGKKVLVAAATGGLAYVSYKAMTKSFNSSSASEAAEYMFKSFKPKKGD